MPIPARKFLPCTLLLAACLWTAPRTAAAERYVAIGASDAVGIGAFPLKKGYVFLIQRSLKQCLGGVRLIDAGIPGAKTNDFVDIELPIAVLSDPDFVTIWAGPNDLVAGTDPLQFESELHDLLNGLAAGTNAKIFIANLPDMTKLPTFQQSPDSDVTPGRIAAYNAAIARQAAQFNAQPVDIFNVPISGALVSPIDGFHPSNRGYAAIAARFLAVMRPQLCPGARRRSRR